jgi:hypothetical protein
MLGLLHNGAQITADRYAASVGPAILVGAAVAWCRLASRDARIAPVLGRGVVAATVLWLVALAALTVPQIGIWKDSVTLWTRAAETEPQSDIPIFYLGWGPHRGGTIRRGAGPFRALARPGAFGASRSASAVPLPSRYGGPASEPAGRCRGAVS